MTKTILVVGLGNPEGKYFQTWHNLGFLAVDALANRLSLTFKKKGNQSLAEFRIPNSELKTIVLKPLTYMNLSGQAVLAVSRKYKIQPENIIVLHDDLYIDKGKIRIMVGGSAAGHNGICSINELLGTNKYIKIKIGIKPDKTPPSGTANFVLSRIDDPSRPLIDTAIEKAVNAVLNISSGDPVPKMQALYNTANSPSPACGAVRRSRDGVVSDD